MIVSAEQFVSYAALPLDLQSPPVDLSALRAFVHRHCEECAFTGNQIRYVAFYVRKPIVGGKLLLHGAQILATAVEPDTICDWDPVFREQFPNFVCWFASLPFRRLQAIALVTQTADIPDHLDVYGNNNAVTYFQRFRHIEPRCYRCILSDPADELARKHSFYVCRDYGGEKRYVVLPPQRSVFAFNSCNCYHGSTYNPGSFKTTVVINGVLEESKHLDILRRSVSSFGGYGVQFEPRPVEGPGAELRYRPAHR